MKIRNLPEVLLVILIVILGVGTLAMVSESAYPDAGAASVATELDQNMLNEAASNRVSDSRYDLPECREEDETGCVFINRNGAGHSFYADLEGNITPVSDTAARAMVGK